MSSNFLTKESTMSEEKKIYTGRDLPPSVREFFQKMEELLPKLDELAERTKGIRVKYTGQMQDEIDKTREELTIPSEKEIESEQRKVLHELRKKLEPRLEETEELWRKFVEITYKGSEWEATLEGEKRSTKITGNLLKKELAAEGLDSEIVEKVIRDARAMLQIEPELKLKRRAEDEARILAKKSASPILDTEERAADERRSLVTSLLRKSCTFEELVGICESVFEDRDVARVQVSEILQYLLGENVPIFNIKTDGEKVRLSTGAAVEGLDGELVIDYEGKMSDSQKNRNKTESELRQDHLYEPPGKPPQSTETLGGVEDEPTDEEIMSRASLDDQVKQLMRKSSGVESRPVLPGQDGKVPSVDDLLKESLRRNVPASQVILDYRRGKTEATGQSETQYPREGDWVSGEGDKQGVVLKHDTSGNVTVSWDDEAVTTVPASQVQLKKQGSLHTSRVKCSEGDFVQHTVSGEKGVVLESDDNGAIVSWNNGSVGSVEQSDIVYLEKSSEPMVVSDDDLIKASQEIGITVSELRKNSRLFAGWTKSHCKKQWEALGGTFDSCLKKMEENVSDPGAYCASLHKRVVGKWPREGRGKKHK